MSVETNTSAVAPATDDDASQGHVVSELVSERPAAPSPFGDDQTFPLPLNRIKYISPTPA